MRVRRNTVSIGAGGGVFLVAGALGFAVFDEEFPSVFYVLPAAVAAGVGARYVATRGPSRPLRSALSGLAAFGYAFFLLWLVSYEAAGTRGVLTFDVIAVLGVAVAVVVAAGVWNCLGADTV